jgi:signal peptidase I
MSHSAAGHPAGDKPADHGDSPAGGAGEGEAEGGAGEAEGGTGGPGGRKGSRGSRARSGALSWLREIGTIIVIALVLSFLIKTFLFRAYYIPSGSMENTLEPDDRIFVNLLVPHPFALQRGDVIVFKDTQGWLAPAPAQANGPFRWVSDTLIFLGLQPDDSQQHLVKRVIGMPGDHVICCDAAGRITVNGKGLDEPYLYPGSKNLAPPTYDAFDVRVPAGKLWVMGDNRNNSADSRYHALNGPGDGFVNESDVEGQAALRAWPLTRLGFIGNYPDTFRDVPAPGPQSAGSPSAVPTGPR